MKDKKDIISLVDKDLSLKCQHFRCLIANKKYIIVGTSDEDYKVDTCIDTVVREDGLKVKVRRTVLANRFKNIEILPNERIKYPTTIKHS